MPEAEPNIKNALPLAWKALMNKEPLSQGM